VLVAFRAKPVQGICGNCELWKELYTFDHVGKCKINEKTTEYAHRCDVPEKNTHDYDIIGNRKKAKR